VSALRVSLARWGHSTGRGSLNQTPSLPARGQAPIPLASPGVPVEGKEEPTIEKRRGVGLAFTAFHGGCARWRRS